MKIQINQVVDHGTLNSEKVQMSVLEDTDLRFYIVADTTFTANDKISNKLRHMYWFTSVEVKQGDQVELYTKAGANTDTTIANGKKKYTIYWGLGNPIWNNDGDGAILFQIEDWATKKAKGTL